MPMIGVPSEVQMSAWWSFLEAHSVVIKALDSELMEDQGLSLTWYDVLPHLSESEGSRLQHQALGRSLLLSCSGVTRLVDRMAEAGLVRREASPDDRRGNLRGDDCPRPVCLGPGVAGARLWHRQHFTRYLGSEDVCALQSFSPGCCKASRKMDVRLAIKTRPTVGDNGICP